MNRTPLRIIALLSLVLLLASIILVPREAEAASAFYGDYTDVAKIADYNSCPSIQGVAVGSQMIYTVKINGDDTQAFITMTDKDSGETTRLYNKDAGSYMFNYLDHANDMDVWGIDGKSHLFVTTTKQGGQCHRASEAGWQQSDQGWYLSSQMRRCGYLRHRHGH